RADRQINRWIFLAPDYRASTRLLIDRLRGLYVEAQIAAAAEEAARETLELEGVQVLPRERLPQQQRPLEIADGEVVELGATDPLRALLPLPDVDFLFPVRVGASVTSVLAVSPGPGRRGLVTHEIDYLRSVALHLGNRLDLLRTEREMIERRTREAVLRE